MLYLGVIVALLYPLREQSVTRRAGRADSGAVWKKQMVIVLLTGQPALEVMVMSAVGDLGA